MTGGKASTGLRVTDHSIYCLVVPIADHSIRRCIDPTLDNALTSIQAATITHTAFFVILLLYCRGYFTAVNLSILITTSRLKDITVRRTAVMLNRSQKYLSLSGGRGGLLGIPVSLNYWERVSGLLGSVNYWEKSIRGIWLSLLLGEGIRGTWLCKLLGEGSRATWFCNLLGEED